MTMLTTGVECGMEPICAMAEVSISAFNIVLIVCASSVLPYESTLVLHKLGTRIFCEGVGYTTYGRTGWNRRARFFEVFEDGRVNSWKRLDDDAFSKIDEQELSDATPDAPTEEFCEWGHPSYCSNGCALWNDLVSDFNTRSQSVVDAKWYLGVGPSSRCCSQPYYDQGNSPWCYCRGTADESAGAAWEFCSPPASRLLL